MAQVFSTCASLVVRGCVWIPTCVGMTTRRKFLYRVFLRGAFLAGAFSAISWHCAGIELV